MNLPIENIQSPQLCLFCEEFYLHTGDPGYSEYTPGYDAAMGCHKDHIDIDLWEDTPASYRKKILTARSCPDFREVEYETQN